MWCPTCQQKVAKPPLTDEEQPNCAVCQTGLLESAPSELPSKEEKSNEALKLLERWADQRMLSPTGEIPEKLATSPLSKPEVPEEKVPEQIRPVQKKNSSAQNLISKNATSAKRKPFQVTKTEDRSLAPQPKLFKHASKRVDTQEKLSGKNEDEKVEKQAEVTSAKVTTGNNRADNKRQTSTAKTSHRPRSSFRTVSSEKRTPKFRVDSAHHSSTAAPHFDVQAAIREQLMKQERSWISAIGYLFSYGGISLLAVGAGLTLWSFYEGTLESVPSEWLVTTVGQIFLFAGLVALVALVMERIGNKILYRVSQVDDRIARLERVVATIADNTNEANSQSSDTHDSKKAA